MHPFEDLLLHQPGVDEWFREMTRVHGANWHIKDREGMARLFATSYVTRFVFASKGADVPPFAAWDQPWSVDTPEKLVLLVDWCVKGNPWCIANVDAMVFLTSLRFRLCSLFEAADSGGWTYDVEVELLGLVDQALLNASRADPPAAGPA
jgi:hypothetical protein